MNNKRFSMLAIAFLLQNMAMATTYGVYGLLLDPLSSAFNSAHFATALGVSLISLMMGLCAPAIGLLLDRWSVRGTVVIGCLLAATGFILASVANSLTLFLFAFGVIAGAGVATMGVLPASKMAALWFPRSTGKAIGFVSIPLLMALAPPLFGHVIATLGWRSLMIAFAIAMILLVPFATRLCAPPSATAASASDSVRPAAAPASLLNILGEARFWWMVVFAGLLQSSALVLFTHIAADAISLGNPLSRASLLLSVLGIASMAGAVAFGWFADRVGPLPALVVDAAAQALLWLGIAVVPEFSALIVLAGCLGFCTGGTSPALFSFIADRWGQERFGRVQGQMTLMMIPFIFGMPPLIGWLFDFAGNYRFAFIVEAAACGFALVLLLAGAHRFRMHQPLGQQGSPFGSTGSAAEV